MLKVSRDPDTLCVGICNSLDSFGNSGGGDRSAYRLDCLDPRVLKFARALSGFLLLFCQFLDSLRQCGVLRGQIVSGDTRRVQPLLGGVQPRLLLFQRRLCAGNSLFQLQLFRSSAVVEPVVSDICLLTSSY